jgi:hypothetical protein
LLLTFPTAPQIPLVALTVAAFHLIDANTAAMWAGWRVAPTLFLKKLDGCQLVGAGGWNLLDYGVIFLDHD